jgi:hypothetical protein
MRHIQLTNLIIQGPIEEERMDSLVSLLCKTHQFQIRLFEMQSVSIESAQKCGHLFQLLASGICQVSSLFVKKYVVYFSGDNPGKLQVSMWFHKGAVSTT